MDIINSPKYGVHYVVTPKLISCITDVMLFLPTVILHLKMINGCIFVYSPALIASTPNYILCRGYAHL